MSAAYAWREADMIQERGDTVAGSLSEREIRLIVISFFLTACASPIQSGLACISAVYA